MTDLQRIEFQMLEQFVAICEKLNLRYYLLGGTLIGAVRHHGFIPWDDDIDVGMPRNDYELFLQSAQNLLPEPYFLQTYETDSEYPNFFAKIRNSDTTFIETSVCKKKMNHGVYIDIFPLDYYPTNWFAIAKLELILRFLFARLVQEYYSLQIRKSLKHILFKPISRMFFPTHRSALIALNNTIRLIKPSPMLRNYGGAWGKKEIAPAEWFGEGTYAEFEGLRVHIPKNYHDYLSQIYGDYMILPPKEKQVGHHYAEAIDIHRPYRDYLHW